MKKIYSGRHLFSYVQRRNKKILRKILPKMLFFSLFTFSSFCSLSISFERVLLFILVHAGLPSFTQFCLVVLVFFFQRFAGFFRSLVEKKEASPIKRYWNDRAGVGGLEFVVSFFFCFFLFFFFLLFLFFRSLYCFYLLERVNSDGKQDGVVVSARAKRYNRNNNNNNNSNNSNNNDDNETNATEPIEAMKP